MGDSTFCYVWFEYWDGEKHSTPVETMNGTGMFNATIENIDDGTTYHYRAIAVGSNGRISYGTTDNFSTPALQNHKPSITPISPENNSVVNVGSSLRVDVNDKDGDSMNISFYMNGERVHSVISGNGSVSVAPQLSYGENYTWYAVVSDGKSENQSAVCHFSTVREMTANFTFDTVFENEIACFNSTSAGGAVQWFWNFGDGNTSYDRNTTHVYKKAGIYPVNLTVTDEYGNSIFISKEVRVLARGDANMDGRINAMDVTKIERIAGGEEGTPPFPDPADVDGDDDVDIDDVAAVIDIILRFT